MTKLDQFESVFRSAAKPTFHLETVKLSRVALVTDLDEAAGVELEKRVRGFLSVLGDEVTWTRSKAGDTETVDSLLSWIKAAKADLIITYRNLHTEAWQWPHSLGPHLDVMCQVVPHPVLVIPHPKAGAEAAHALDDTSSVMAMTDHLAGDNHLVSMAARLTDKGGKLYLTHIEDEVTFDRYADVISKIPTIDTEDAVTGIREQLLKEPRDFIRSTAEGLRKAGWDIHVEEIVSLGKQLDNYRSLIAKHKVDLLVMNTKDHDQLAMHGMAYPLAVELRQVPLLLL